MIPALLTMIINPLSFITSQLLFIFLRPNEKSRTNIMDTLVLQAVVH